MRCASHKTFTWRLGPATVLRALVECRERIGVPVPPGYRTAPVHWWLDLDLNGRLVDVVRTSEATGPQERKVGVRWPLPYVRVTNNVAARLLADSGAHALARLSPMLGTRSRARTILGHAAFVDLVHACARDTGDPAVIAVQRFLETLNPAQLELPGDLFGDDICAFRVEGQSPVVDREAVQVWWARRLDSGPVGECLVCGKSAPIARVHPIVRGIAGGQPAGMALVSANSPAFQSYGLNQGLTSPVCQSCAQGYTETLTALLSDDAAHTLLPDSMTTIVAFTDQGSTGNLLGLLAHPDEYGVRSLSLEPSNGVATDDRWYGACFSPSGGRIVLRDWIDTTVLAARQHLATYFARQGLPDREGRWSWYSPHALERSLVLPGRREGRAPERSRLSPNVARALVRNAFAGDSLPQWLLHLAVRRASLGRTVADGGQTFMEAPLASLIKLLLLTRAERPAFEALMGSEHAYLCGRLLALWDLVHRRAVPGAKTTAARRSFGAAATAPARVFPRLIGIATEHLGRIRRATRPLHAALQGEVSALLGQLPAFPESLDLRGQGLFALGYYYQRAGLHVAPADVAARQRDVRAA